MTTLVADPALESFVDEVGDAGAVVVEGGRTRWTLGGPPADGARHLRAPDGVVDYQPAEMIVRVRAGTPVAELHAALATKGQRTGLPERGGTVGGAVAVGQNDLRVLGRGSVGRAVLQVRYVSSEGALVTGGGAVVKNVSGFNIPKLMVGSLGTLGLIAEVVLRTNPIPPVSLWLVSSDADPFAAYDALLRPSVMLWDGQRTWVAARGSRPRRFGRAEDSCIGRFVRRLRGAASAGATPVVDGARRSSLSCRLWTPAVSWPRLASGRCGPSSRSRRDRPIRPAWRSLDE